MHNIEELTPLIQPFEVAFLRLMELQEPGKVTFSKELRRY